MDKQVITRSFQDKCVYCVSGGLYIQIWGQCEREEALYVLCWSKSLMVLDDLKEETCCSSVTDQV